MWLFPNQISANSMLCSTDSTTFSKPSWNTYGVVSSAKLQIHGSQQFCILLFPEFLLFSLSLNEKGIYFS